SENALEIIKDFDVVADGTDNFPTRYLINDACVMLGKPNVYASIFRFEGQLTVFNYEDGPCYRCLYPEPPPPGLVPSCAEGGVLGVLPGIMGSLQANEVIKLITGIGEPMKGRLLTFDALTLKFRELRLRHDHDCVVCGEEPSVTELIDYVQFCGVPQNDHQAEEEASEVDITPIELRDRMKSNSMKLIDVREPHEWDIGRIEGATLIPLGEIEQHVQGLPRDEEIILYCKMGGRSMKALNALKDHGFVHLRNLKGGINAWSRDVDPNVPQY
ncbi:MAG: ThiF family adenylyltransferase, partial [Myxococcota bacterium]